MKVTEIVTRKKDFNLITNKENSLNKKIVIAIKTVFDDLTNKIVNKELNKFTVGSTSALFYLFKTDGNFDIIEFIPGENNTESFYDTYHNNFCNSDFDFSIKICDMLFLNNIQQLNKFYSTNSLTKDLIRESMKDICAQQLNNLDNKNYTDTASHFYSNGNVVTILTSEEFKKSRFFK